MKDNTMIRRRLFALPLLAISALAPAYAQSCDTSFVFVNSSSSTVNEFYFDPASSANYSRDELGSGVLAPGGSKNFRAANSGMYDFLAVLENGRRVEMRGRDVCVIRRVTLTNSGMTAE
jgi:hypothetical protein